MILGFSKQIVESILIISKLFSLNNEMTFLNKILKRPSNEKPFVLLIVGRPDVNTKVPKFAKQKKKFEEITSIF